MARALSSTRPELVGSINAEDTINGVAAIPGEDSVISIGEDKTLKVWVKRENGQYWPSIVQAFDASCSALSYQPEDDSDGHNVFVGLSNGQIHEYRLSADLNRFERRRTYSNHSSRVTCVKFISKHQWLLSTARDKRFQWSNTATGGSLGGHECTAWCMTVEYDETNKYAFVGDYGGSISVLKLSETNFHLFTTLRGHTSSIWAMAFDPERRILFSGGFDQIIVVWDIGSQQGTAYELQGHDGKIRSLVYSTMSRRLMSMSEDKLLGVWDLNTEREETTEWAMGDTCEKCGVPFFWNIKGMWEQKAIGVRQHHCRKCGRAICAQCSNQLSTFPKMGFEKPVRMCQDCHSVITTDDRAPLASFRDMKCVITHTSLVQNRATMVTASNDKIIKIWNISPILT